MLEFSVLALPPCILRYYSFFVITLLHELLQQLVTVMSCVMPPITVKSLDLGLQKWIPPAGATAPDKKLGFGTPKMDSPGKGACSGQKSLDLRLQRRQILQGITVTA